MKVSRSYLLAAGLATVGGLICAASFSLALAATKKTADSGSARATVSSKVASKQGSSAAAFESFAPVLRHPRCMNCHSNGDFPRQGDDSHPHAMEVHRGTAGLGVTAEKCGTCHQDHNLDGLNMPPGAPGWRLPSSAMPMIWEGLSDHQLCELLKDRKRNGDRSPDEIVEHMNTPLVLWGWHPGEGRTPIPMSRAEFTAKVKTWAASGAGCPAE